MDAMGIVPTFDFQKIHSRHVFVAVCIPDVADHNLYRMMWKRYHTWRHVVGLRSKGTNISGDADFFFSTKHRLHMFVWYTTL